MPLSLAEGVAAYTAGVNALLAADIDAPSHRDLLASFAAIHATSQRVPMTGYAILARLDREANPVELGATSLRKAIAWRCRMSSAEVGRQVQRARALIGRRNLQGQELAPEWEHTATALAGGEISDEHVVVIGKFFKALPSFVDPTTRARAEQSLAEAATTLDPQGLTAVAIQLLAMLHPDGEAPAEEIARKVGLTLGPQQPDGTSYLRGWVSPKLRALIEPILAKFTERSRHGDTGDQTPSETPSPVEEPEPEAEAEPKRDSADDIAADDIAAEHDPFGPDPDAQRRPSNPLLNEQWRSKAQFTHDAFEAALDLLLRSGTLGRLNGLPTTVVVTCTLQDLLRGAGFGVTGGGSLLPMRDLIALAANAYHYLAVFDEHTGETLHLGRAQRCASGAQKLALFARERGCTCPGCTVDWYRTQAHHAVLDWKRDGLTNVDDLTLACQPGNQMIEDTGWVTRKRPDGRFEWVDPVTGRAHLKRTAPPRTPPQTRRRRRPSVDRAGSAPGSIPADTLDEFRPRCSRSAGGDTLEFTRTPEHTEVRTMRRLIGSMLLGFAAVATAAGCSFSTGGVTVAKDDVATEISNQLKQEVGRAPESVTCPSDLKGEVGATLRCDLQDGGETYGVTATVTKVDGTNVKFDIKVDDEPS